MKSLILISFCSLIIACHKSAEKKEVKEPIVNNDTEIVEKKDWKDSLILEYLKNPKNELIKGTVNSNDSLPIAWMTEIQERDGKVFTAVQIGKNTEYRFATAGWIYLDSLNKSV